MKTTLFNTVVDGGDVSIWCPNMLHPILHIKRHLQRAWGLMMVRDFVNFIRLVHYNPLGGKWPSDGGFGSTWPKRYRRHDYVFALF